MPRCVVCGSKNIRKVRRAVKLQGRREIPARELAFEECQACGERYFDIDSAAKLLRVPAR